MPLRRGKSPRFHKPAYYSRILLAYLAVLIIPIFLISLANFHLMRKESFRRLEERLQLEARRELGILEMQLKTINSIAYESRYSKHYNPYYREEKPSTYIAISEELKSRAGFLPFCEGIYFWQPSEALAAGAHGKYSPDYFAEHVLRFREPLTRLPLSADDGYKIRRLRYGPGSAPGFAIFTPWKSLLNGEEKVGTLIFVIADKRLEEWLDPPVYMQGAEVVLTYRDEPVYSSDPAFNELLFTSGGTELSWPAADYHYEFDGASEFALHWMVPKAMFDEELFRQIFRQMAVLAVVLSIGLVLVRILARRNYRPIRDLLKQIGSHGRSLQAEPQLDELDRVGYYLSDLQNWQAILEDYNSQLRRERLLYELIASPPAEEGEILRRGREAGLALDKRSLLFIFFPDSPENQALFTYLTGGSRAADGDEAYQMYLKDGRYAYLICSDRSAEELEAVLDEFSRGGARLCRGEVADSAEALPLAYTSARRALRRCLGKETAHENYPFTLLAELQEAAELSQGEEIDRIMAELMQSSAGLPESLQAALSLDILKLLLEPAELNAKLAEASQPGPAALKSLLRTVYKSYKTKLETEQGPVYKKRNLAEMLSYIDENYADYHFSVKKMALDFSMSPSNLSHYFKKASGQNLSAYVESLKLEKSKQLLAEGELKVFEIAEQLGFGSPAVFIEFFKKHEGITPGAFAPEGED